MASKSTSADLHPIGVVSRRTGLGQDVIRAWERRYGAVAPERLADGSRRLYSAEQIERLSLLKRCVDSGWRISDVATRGREELLELVGTMAAGSSPTRREQPPREIEAMRSEAIDAVLSLDRDRLQRLLGDAAVQLSAPALRNQLILPTLERIGDLWREGLLRPAHEHLATAIVRSFLGSLRSSATDPDAPRLLVTTPSGQRHELGALMVAAAADELGWRVFYLGPDLPAEEIAASALQLDVRAVALSVVYVESEHRLIEECRRLRHALPGGVGVLVGGRAVESLRGPLEAVGMSCPGDLLAFQRHLERLGASS